MFSFFLFMLCSAVLCSCCLLKPDFLRQCSFSRSSCVGVLCFNMNKIIDHQFQRVDAALKQLVTSIAQFNPNSIHAAELVAADQDLAKGLDLCMPVSYLYVVSTNATQYQRIRRTLPAYKLFALSPATSMSKSAPIFLCLRPPVPSL